MPRPPKTESSATVEDQPNHEGIVKKYVVLRLFNGDKYPLRLTVSRAKLICKHIADIQSFANIYDEQKTTLGRTLT